MKKEIMIVGITLIFVILLQHFIFGQDDLDYNLRYQFKRFSLPSQIKDCFYYCEKINLNFCYDSRDYTPSTYNTATCFCTDDEGYFANGCDKY